MLFLRTRNLFFLQVNEHSCEKYELEAKLPRRTHTYFIDNMAGRHHDSIPFVTLVTQLMLNRIGNLERLLASWKGPSQVALYLTDEEVVTFKEIYNNSNILQQADATYHVIYKRQVSVSIIHHDILLKYITPHRKTQRRNHTSVSLNVESLVHLFVVTNELIDQ